MLLWIAWLSLARLAFKLNLSLSKRQGTDPTQESSLTGQMEEKLI